MRKKDRHENVRTKTRDRYLSIVRVGILKSKNIPIRGIKIGKARTRDRKRRMAG